MEAKRGKTEFFCSQSCALKHRHSTWPQEKKPEFYDVQCAHCGNLFRKGGKAYRSELQQGKTDLFCSLTCAAKHRHANGYFGKYSTQDVKESCQRAIQALDVGDTDTARTILLQMMEGDFG